mgnify:CR=1 FL=1
MEYLKKLLGDAYHEGMTVEEINTALSKGKFVNLSSGNYVDKDKYNNAVSERDEVKAKLADLETKTKDYDTLKSENDKFKGEKADADLKAKLVALGVNEKAFKYVKGDINDKSLVLGDDDKANKTAVETYLKANPQFAAVNPNPAPRTIFSTTVGGAGDGKEKTTSKSISDRIREAAGHKVEVGND